MPNILIGYNGRFEPFSFEELLKPIAYATEQQNAYEAAYEKIGDTADAIGSQLNEGDVNSLAIYNNYSQKLDAARDQLLEKGFKDPNARKALKDVRKEFNNGMLKVGSAVEQRNKDLAARNKMLLEHPNMAVSPIGSVDSYLAGTNKPLQSVDLNVQYNKAVAAGKGITSRMWNDPEFRNGMMLIRHGLASPNEVMDMLSNSTITDENGNTYSKYPEFQTAIRSLLISSGQENLSDADSDRVTSTIMDGLIAGMIYDEKWSGIPSSGRSGGSGSGSSSGAYNSPRNIQGGDSFSIGTSIPTQISNQSVKTNQSKLQSAYNAFYNKPDVKGKAVGSNTSVYDPRNKRLKEGYITLVEMLPDPSGRTSGIPIVIGNDFSYVGRTKEHFNNIRSTEEFVKYNFEKAKKAYAAKGIKYNDEQIKDNLRASFRHVYNNVLTPVGLKAGDNLSMFDKSYASNQNTGASIKYDLYDTYWGKDEILKALNTATVGDKRKTKDRYVSGVWDIKSDDGEGKITTESLVPVEKLKEASVIHAYSNPSIYRIDKSGNKIHGIIVIADNHKYFLDSENVNSIVTQELQLADEQFKNLMSDDVVEEILRQNFGITRKNMTSEEYRSAKQIIKKHVLDNYVINMHKSNPDVDPYGFTKSDQKNW